VLVIDGPEIYHKKPEIDRKTGRVKEARNNMLTLASINEAADLDDYKTSPALSMSKTQSYPDSQSKSKKKSGWLSSIFNSGNKQVRFVYNII